MGQARRDLDFPTCGDTEAISPAEMFTGDFCFALENEDIDPVSGGVQAIGFPPPLAEVAEGKPGILIDPDRAIVVILIGCRPGAPPP